MSYFKGKQVLVTAGPTYEKIDDVRFIGNFSTGKMGFALAEASIYFGAITTLIAGPTGLVCNKTIERVNVTSAKEMFGEVISKAEEFDVVIMAAAVADYTPKVKYEGKIKKKSDSMTIDLVRTKDILKELGVRKPKNQILVGFALESENLLEYAKEKLKSKNCNIIVANLANTENSGFGKDVNTVTIIDDKGGIKELPTDNKVEIAKSILNYVSEYAEQHYNH